MGGEHSELCLQDEWRAERASHFGCFCICSERIEQDVFGCVLEVREEPENLGVLVYVASGASSKIWVCFGSDEQSKLENVCVSSERNKLETLGVFRSVVS